MTQDTAEIASVQAIDDAPPPAAAVSSTDPFLSMVNAAIAAKDPGLVKEMVTLLREEREDQRKQAFHKAMAAFKRDAPPAVFKNKQVHFRTAKGVTNYRHVSLDHACEVYAPIMAKHGLVHDWDQEQNGDQVKVTCVVTHEDGHSKSNFVVLREDHTGNKNGSQAVTSAVSYGRRITFFGAIGVAGSDEDDDGAATSEPAASVIDDQGVGIIRDLLVQTESDEAKFLKTLATSCNVPAIASVEEIPEDLFETARGFFSKKLARMRALGGGDGES